MHYFYVALSLSIKLVVRGFLAIVFSQMNAILLLQWSSLNLNHSLCALLCEVSPDITKLRYSPALPSGCPAAQSAYRIGKSEDFSLQNHTLSILNPTINIYILPEDRIVASVAFGPNNFGFRLKGG